VEATTVAAVVGTVGLGEVLAWHGEAIGPRDTEERSAWRTEIGWPVFRTTAK
jgi:hypothetical protein